MSVALSWCSREQVRVPSTGPLGRAGGFLLAFAGGSAVANTYYAQPLLIKSRQPCDELSELRRICL
jgi:hypothetical protein